jgi:hypothetical protein
MLERWRTKIATAPPAVNATTGQDASKRSANNGSAAADASEAKDA